MNRIKFGVCGLGRMGVEHCRYFSMAADKYELVAACDREPDRVARVTGKYGCAGHADLAEFARQPDMELAIIATRSLDHVVNARQMLAAGKTVLLEKPIAVTENDYNLLRQVNQQYPDKLFFLHNHRFEPAFENIQKIIASGVLGSVNVVQLCRHHGFRRRGDWQMLLDCGGGQLSVWGPHLLDQALQYINAPVKEVWGKLKHVITPGDADDHIKIMLVGENDVLAEIEISDAIALPGAYCTVHGTRGGLVCPDEKNIHLKYIDPAYKLPERQACAGQPPPSGGLGNDEQFPWIEETRAVTPATNMWEYVEIAIAAHLYRAIRENIPFPIRNADALEVVRITNLLKKQNNQFAWKI